MKYLRRSYSAHKLPEINPPGMEKHDFGHLISNFTMFRCIEITYEGPS